MADETGARIGTNEPATDWAKDWDWLDARWGSDVPEIWDDLRAQAVEMAFTERHGWARTPITHSAVDAIAHDTANFSSIRVSAAVPSSPHRKAFGVFVA